MNNSFKQSNWTSPASGLDVAAEVVYNMPIAWKPRALGDDIMEEERIVEKMQYQWQNPSFQTTNAMDFDSSLYNCQPQHTVASPDLSSGTCEQLPTTCLSFASLQLEVPPITNATVAVHTEVPVSPPRAAQRSRELQQQELPAPAHARPAKARGRPMACGRASAERSAGRGRSCSRSPIRDADVAITDVSGEAGSGKVLLRTSSDEEHTGKKQIKKKGRQPKKKTGLGKKKGVGKKKGAAKKKGGKGGQEKKSSVYLGVSFHSLNRKWRTTVYYEGDARHMGYHSVEKEAARQYDELALVVWDETTETNFPIKDYSDKQTLEAKWLPILQAKVAAQEKRREEAEKAARNALEAAKAKLGATGGISKKPANKAQHRRKKRASSYSDSDVTISDASLNSLLNDDDEGEFCSRRSPASVATRAPRPRREAAKKAQENLNALMEELSDSEKESDEVPPVADAACRHARATAAAERRLRASQGDHQPHNKTSEMPGVQSTAALQPAVSPSPQAAQLAAAFGNEMEMMDVDAIDDGTLTDIAKPVGQHRASQLSWRQSGHHRLWHTQHEAL